MKTQNPQAMSQLMHMPNGKRFAAQGDFVIGYLFQA
jgi:hypothetical protein